jgi:ubiquinone/menaquinone biosynthesis C-methylase UbiE
MAADHRDVIRDQFTRQAEAFAAAAPMHDADAMRLLLEMACADSDSTVLDVACGPGIVTCAFAGLTKRAIGIDLTPAMLGQARALAARKSVENVGWCIGDVARLPFPSDSFSIVVSRFAFHHMEAPDTVLAEMVRLCRRDGHIAVVVRVSSLRAPVLA